MFIFPYEGDLICMQMHGLQYNSGKIVSIVEQFIVIYNDSMHCISLLSVNIQFQLQIQSLKVPPLTLGKLVFIKDKTIPCIDLYFYFTHENEYFQNCMSLCLVALKQLEKVSKCPCFEKIVPAEHNGWFQPGRRLGNFLSNHNECGQIGHIHSKSNYSSGQVRHMHLHVCLLCLYKTLTTVFAELNLWQPSLS